MRHRSSPADKTTRHTASCTCGAVEITLDAPPIAALSCCCDDCQAAALALEALPGAPEFREACGGTPAVLFAKSALKVTKGRDKLTAHRLTPGARTKRMVASCCNSFLYVAFDRGPFWVDVVSARMDGAPAPRWRIQTRYLAEPPPADLPNHPKYPQGLVWRIALAGVLAGLPGR